MKVQCRICPRMCEIEEGRTGACRVRANVNGEIIPLTYGKPCSIAIDPVEKKPLYHFLPGSNILSVGTAGCNLHCKFCQNWEISQSSPEDLATYDVVPKQLVDFAVEKKCLSIAYTYTDPTVFYEYAFDCSVQAHEVGIKNVLVTAAYINPGPWRRICGVTDAANVDLKALSEKFYRDICGAELKPVLDALVAAKEIGVMLELTNLVIPGLNDSDADLQKLSRWVKENLGKETPLHFSRFFPQYRMTDRNPTSKERLQTAREIALSEGMNFVYIGNIITKGAENTVCPSCGEMLIERSGFNVSKNILKNGKCPKCGCEIYGIWNG
ncbi:MAG: AmmeMemoRadiSam system radical SAM enzyme [Kiritimatiellia bacterium]